MEEINLSETTFARAKADFRKALGSIGFWLLDAGGGAVVGLLSHPACGVAWIAAIAAITFLFLWARAPVSQRDEARSKCLELTGVAPDWLDMETAGRLFRDLMVSYGMGDGVRMFDSMVESDRGQRGRIESAFRFHAIDGINDGVIVARGVPENGSNPEILDSVDESFDAWCYFSEGGDPDFIETGGVRYISIQFNKASVKAYAKFVRDHDAELKRRTQRQS